MTFCLLVCLFVHILFVFFLFWSLFFQAAVRAKQIAAANAVKTQKAKVAYNQGLIKTFKKSEYQTGSTHVDHIIKKTGMSVRDLKKVPAKHPGRDAKAHHPAHLGGHKPSIDVAGRISGKVGNNYYWRGGSNARWV